MASRHTRTEVDAYTYIKQQLKELAWDTRNPGTNPAGQVWTQNQCLKHPTIKRALGLDRPENIVKLSERYLWVIEAKADRRKIGAADAEAQDYAGRINVLAADVEAKLATGLAGNDAEGYTVHNFVNVDGNWLQVTINGQKTTGLLSSEDVRALLDNGTNDVHDFTPDQWRFLQAAERINSILYAGGINKNDRAKVMAALLLSVVGPAPNLNTTLPVLIGEINTRSKAILDDNGKGEFAPFIQLLPPTNTTNHVQYRDALVRTIQELRSLNIRSAMNSSTDVLGQFYEVFLKYGNGAKEIGIVLTPRHVTRFAVDAIGISPSDIVLDPACGTGGFLVAAYDHIRRNGTPTQVDRFKVHNLFGIENDPTVAILAIVNMIFRGDGKNNLVEGSCFSTHLATKNINGHSSAAYTKETTLGNEAVTRILMNPPFKNRSSGVEEYLFLTRALEFMADGGLLFSLLPLDCMFGANDEKVWRESELLAKHTLLSVVSFPDELFYPAAMKQVVGVFVRKGFPHPAKQPVFWARVAADGYIKVKSKRLLASAMRPPRMSEDNLPGLLPQLRNFLVHPASTSVNEPMRCKTAPIDFSDPLLELLPEAYLDGPQLTEQGIEDEIDRLIRETAALAMRNPDLWDADIA